MLRYGYNSNGFADHSLEQMVQVLRHLGYSGVGLTLDHVHLDPFQCSQLRRQRVRSLLEGARLEPVVETGARYYLDPYRKHRPSLVSVEREGRGKRVTYYQRAIDIAAEIGARCVSLWSGVAQPGTPAEVCWTRLEETLPGLLHRAQAAGVCIAFEPEPGMFVEDLAGYEELKQRIDHPALGLTLDLGHLAITEPPPLERAIERFREDLLNVHVDDVRDGRHEHLPLGEGELDFEPLLAALVRTGYRGLVQVELSRHSHMAPLMAERSLIYLRRTESRTSP
ncbi:MAG: sugar phosphate isomerase/epimerase family protein [Planctomycetota bacterium]